MSDKSAGGLASARLVAILVSNDFSHMFMTMPLTKTRMDHESLLRGARVFQGGKRAR